jgi:Na+/glutamate symporter
MIHRAAWAFSVLAVLLGAAHLALTWPVYRAATLEALWFAGSGLAVLSTALLNIQALRQGGRRHRWLLFLANLVMAAFFAAAWPLLKGPQVALGFALFLGLAAFALTPRKPAVA